MTGLILGLLLLTHISPERIIIRPGDSVRLNISGGKVKEILVLPSRIGFVRNGFFHAKRKGEGVIKVVFANKPPSYAYVKIPGSMRVLDVRLVPEEARIMPGDSLQFSIRIPEGINPEDCFFNWRVVPSWIGQIDFNGKFIAGNRFGRGKVVAVVRCGRRRGIAFSSIVVGDESNFSEVSVIPNPVYVPDVIKGKVKLDIVPGISDFDSIDWLVEPSGLGFVNERFEFIPIRSHGRGVLWFTGWKGNKVYTGKTFILVGKPHSRIELSKRVAEPGDSITVKILMRYRVHRKIFSWGVEPEWLGRFTDPRRFPETTFIAGDKNGVGTIFIMRRGRPVDFTRSPIIVGAHRVTIEPQDTIIKVGENLNFRVDKSLKGFWRVFPPIAGEITRDGKFRAEVPLREAFIIFEVNEDGGGGGITTLTILP